jgi:hypothetical protein
MTYVLSYPGSPGFSDKLTELDNQSGSLDMFKAYNLHHQYEGRNWLIPKPLDNRLVACLSTVIVRKVIMHGVSRSLFDTADYCKHLQSEIAEF